MSSVVERPQLRTLLANSGEPRQRATFRTDMTTTLLSVWFVLGLFLDAWAHANVPELESFFTPWHAVFYSGFAATGAWILWVIWRNVQSGRRGIAAVPLGYGLTVVALPVFAVSGAADYAWHTFLGIETTTDIFFSPSHLGLITSMILILTSPLRSAWSDPGLPATPSMRRLLPAVLTTAFATSLILLFVQYGNALTLRAGTIVNGFSQFRGQGLTADGLAVRMLVTNIVLLTPLLLIARRWHLPFGTATILHAVCATISGALAGFQNVSTLFVVVLAGVCVDLLARWLRPSGAQRNAFWLFGALAPLLTWTLFLAAASIWAGRLPAIPEMWTGAPIVAALIGWLLSALMMPNAVREPVPIHTTGGEAAVVGRVEWQDGPSPFWWILITIAVVAAMWLVGRSPWWR